MFTKKKHGTERLCLHKDALSRAFFTGSIAPHTNDMRKTGAAKQRRTVLRILDDRNSTDNRKEQRS